MFSPHLIYTVTTTPDNQGPVLFSKLDIKDGYWQMVIDPDNKWNFAYMLPKLSHDEPMQLVMPSCLQMGWCKSASYFCAASKTSRDIGDTLSLAPIGSLPLHPLEHHLVPPAVDMNHAPYTLTDTNQHTTFLHLLEVYIDNFIQLTQTTSKTQLLYLSCALLHAIHSIFPSPSVTSGTEEDPVAMKKLLQVTASGKLAKNCLVGCLTVLGNAQNYWLTNTSACNWSSALSTDKQKYPIKTSDDFKANFNMHALGCQSAADS